MNPSQNQPAAQPQAQQAPGIAAQPQAQPQAAPQPHPVDESGAPKKPKVNPSSTQNMLQVAEIRDGVAIMNDGSFRSVVMCKSINFDLMSAFEQEAVEGSYQSFLNSLYFPIQIFIRSQKVDIRPYIERLDKIRSEHDNMLLALLMEDYIAYISELSTQTNIMNKAFYVIVPYFPKTDAQHAVDQSKSFFTGITALFSKSGPAKVVVNEKTLEDAKIELRNRVGAVLNGLDECGVQSVPLDTQELIELFYDFYNPDTATRQQLKNFNDITADVITKGEGKAPQPNLNKDLL